MWKYQDQTCRSFQNDAQQFFNHFSFELNPEILLIGLQNDIPEYPTICTVPQTEQIKNYLEELTKDESSISSNIWPLRDKIKSKFNDMYKDKITFISNPVYLKRHNMLVVLKLDKLTCNSIFLEKSIFGTIVCILNFIVKEFFDNIIPILKEQHDEMYITRSITHSIDYMRTNVCTNYVSKILSLFSQLNTNSYVWVFDKLSSLQYEKNINTGSILICNENHKNIEIILKFKERIWLKSTGYRKIRKLLEITNNDLFLYGCGWFVSGIAKIKNTDNLKNDDLIFIKFLGLNAWQLIHGETVMLTIKDKKPVFDKPETLITLFYDLLSKKFSSITDEDKNTLWDIINQCKNQKKGTLIIISGIADKESLRLKNDSIYLMPKFIHKNIYKQLSSIDGAILLDIHGICHSIGVILDGVSTISSDSGRGSRYNSAIRYVDLKSDSIAVIISEDGMVDLYPTLPKKINKSEIYDLIEALQQNLLVVTKDINSTMGPIWHLDRHRFYLSAEQCNTINNCINDYAEKYNEKFNDDFITSLNEHLNTKLYENTTFKYFEPNPHFDDTFFID